MFPKSAGFMPPTNTYCILLTIMTQTQVYGGRDKELLSPSEVITHSSSLRFRQMLEILDCLSDHSIVFARHELWWFKRVGVFFSFFNFSGLFFKALPSSARNSSYHPCPVPKTFTALLENEPFPSLLSQVPLWVPWLPAAGIAAWTLTLSSYTYLTLDTSVFFRVHPSQGRLPLSQ